MSSLIDHQANGVSTPLSCVLDKISRIVERRIKETRIKTDNLKDVYVTERAARFVQEDVHDIENSGKQYLFNKVLECRQLALERRNTDLERRLIVNETINAHFEDVIIEFERDLLSVLKDAIGTEVNRVAYCQSFKDENTKLAKRLEEEERYSLKLVEEKETLEGKAIQLDAKVNELSDKLNEMEEKLTELQTENRKLTMDSSSMINRLKSDADEFKKLQDTLADTEERNATLLEKVKGLENQLEVEKHRVKAVCAEYEDRFEREKHLLREEMQEKQQELLLEQRSTHNLITQRMKEAFEKRMKEASDYCDDCAQKLKNYVAKYTELREDFNRQLIKAVTKQKQELEKKYMKIASVSITVGKSDREKDKDIVSDMENIPRRILRDWQQSDADSFSTASTVSKSSRR